MLTLFNGQMNQQLLLLGRIRNELPLPLANHLLHCVANQKKLTIYTDSAVWATQLRFHTDQILRTASHPGTDAFEKLHIRIFTEHVKEERDNREKGKLPSSEKIHLIRDEGDYFEDNRLGHSLRKLSETLTRLSEQKRRKND